MYREMTSAGSNLDQGEASTSTRSNADGLSLLASYDSDQDSDHEADEVKVPVIKHQREGDIQDDDDQVTSCKRARLPLPDGLRRMFADEEAAEKVADAPELHQV